MNVTQAIEARHAVKKYDTDFKISDSEIKEFMELVLKAPSSYNLQHWRFVDVQNEDLREQIKQAAYGQAQVSEASRLFVLCGDVKAWEKQPEQYWQHVPEDVRENIVKGLRNFYEGREWIQRDEVLRSAGLISMTLMLAATEKGWATGPMIGFDQDKVAQIINLPKDHIIAMLIVMGKPKDGTSKSGSHIAYDKAVVKNKF